MILDLKYLIDKYKMNINGVLHIGAHYGEEYELYKTNEIKNVVYFEPISTSFNILKNKIGDDGILFNCALGNENKYVEMYVETANLGQSSSILEPMLHKTQYPTIIFDSKETVKMVRLDDIEINIKNYNLINLDVQGYELEVFKGAEETLKNIDYIISEINNDETYLGCAKINELEDFLSPYGFKLVEQNWAGITYGDGFFIKTKN